MRTTSQILDHITGIVRLVPEKGIEWAMFSMLTEIAIILAEQSAAQPRVQLTGASDDTLSGAEPPAPATDA